MNMQALGFYEHGDINKMQLLSLPKPVPQEKEVLVRLHASAFNHLDIWVRKGWPGIDLKIPHISGSDGAGVVEALGPGANQYKLGDRVAIDPGINTIDDEFTARGEHSVSPGFLILGEHLPGTHADYVVVPERNLLKIPDHISFEQAAAAGLVGTTAWRMLIHRANIKPAESVLIMGAGGGVNSIAIQIAKLAGCKVYTTTSSEEKMAQAKALGADEVVNYKESSDWPKQLYRLSNKQGFDVIVDNIGQATFNESIRLVKRGGGIVIVGNTTGAMTEIDLRYLFTKQISLIGSTMGNHYDYCQVMKLVFAGKLSAPIYTTMPLSDGIAAMKMLEHGEQFGKIVLTR